MLTRASNSEWTWNGKWSISGFFFAGDSNKSVFHSRGTETLWIPKGSEEVKFSWVNDLVLIPYGWFPVCSAIELASWFFLPVFIFIHPCMYAYNTFSLNVFQFPSFGLDCSINQSCQNCTPSCLLKFIGEGTCLKWVTFCRIYCILMEIGGSTSNILTLF